MTEPIHLDDPGVPIVLTVKIDHTGQGQTLYTIPPQNAVALLRDIADQIERETTEEPVNTQAVPPRELDENGRWKTNGLPLPHTADCQPHCLDHPVPPLFIERDPLYDAYMET